MENKTKSPCMSSKNECCICFEDQTDKLTSKLPCNHEMCVSCTITLSPPLCPLCRKNFSSALEEFKNIYLPLSTFIPKPFSGLDSPSSVNNGTFFCAGI